VWRMLPYQPLKAEICSNANIHQSLGLAQLHQFRDTLRRIVQSTSTISD